MFAETLSGMCCIHRLPKKSETSLTLMPVSYTKSCTAWTTEHRGILCINLDTSPSCFCHVIIVIIVHVAQVCNNTATQV